MQINSSKQHAWISGSNGLIGRALFTQLQKQGYQVQAIAHQQHKALPYVDIDKNEFSLNGHPAPNIIIHLAGKNIANSRWTEKNKQKFVDSRIKSTQLIANYIKQSEHPPTLFICASAIGFYGDSGIKVMTEESQPNTEFVSRLAQEWESTAQIANTTYTRVASLRTGIVLDKNDGALSKMYPAFQFGLGGKVGNGQQYMSWISLKDHIRAILFIMNNQRLNGPINLVSPNPIKNKEFTEQLAQVLHRPYFFHLPSVVIKAIFSEMGEALLLSSTRVVPKKLLAAGFEFESTKLKKCLIEIMKS